MNLKIRRLIATYIDFILIFYIIYIPAHYLDLLIDNIFIEILISIILIAVFGLLLLRKDCIFGFESVGKKIVRLKIYQNGKQITDKKLLTNRVIKTFKSIPLYIFMILKDNKSSGDIELNTEVK